MALIEPEIALDVDLYGYWDPILAIWFKPPATDGFDCLFIQARTQGPLNANVARTPVGPHHEPTHNRTLVSGLASFSGEFRRSGAHLRGCN